MVWEVGTDRFGHACLVLATTVQGGRTDGGQTVDRGALPVDAYGRPGDRRTPTPLRLHRSSTADAASASSGVGVDGLPDGRQLAAQLLVARGLLIDLLAGMQDRGVVTTSELGTDAQE